MKSQLGILDGRFWRSSRLKTAELLHCRFYNTVECILYTSVRFQRIQNVADSVHVIVCVVCGGSACRQKRPVALQNELEDQFVHMKAGSGRNWFTNLKILI